jgi:hypothetical protein
MAKGVLNRLSKIVLIPVKLKVNSSNMKPMV